MRFRSAGGAVLGILAAACGGAAAPEVVPVAVAARPGLEVILGDSAALIAGKRVGLVTNQSGVDATGVSGVDRLRAAGVQLVALFSPEHGFRGTADPGEAVASTVDPATGLPIYSLYGRNRVPSDSVMRSLDVMLVDLQDAGARYYTYLATTVDVMRAAQASGRTVVVLDRPNPIGGAVEGNVLDTAYKSDVGLLAMPMRHGMTLGELARMARSDLGLTADLRVVPVARWARSEAFDQTQLPFVAPSPNLRTLEALFHYPGTCLFEGTALSVGRGTPNAFEQIGAPWLDTTAVLHRMREAKLPGVEFSGVTFTPTKPGDAKYADTALVGIRLHVTDRRRYDPTVTAVYLLAAVQAVHPDKIGFLVRGFDRLAGGAELRTAILAGEAPHRIVERWKGGLERFLERRKPFLIYPE
ncbi:MAG TPA: DUF1343 domain-containing protein [Gemmatimonadales bacterium]|nr:DUF1343 domain-containing protein [Gemmatimonadales bacterium]